MADVIGTDIFRVPRFLKEGNGIEMTQPGTHQALTISVSSDVQGYATVPGVEADGVTDDAPAINAAIATLADQGGGVIQLPQGTIAIASTIAVTTSNILIRGWGGDQRHDVGSQHTAAATRLKWTGSAGGTMVSFISPTGASAQKMRGGGLRSLTLDANSSAAKCLDIQSWNSAEFKDLFMYEPTSTAINVNVVATLGEARDSQENVFDRIWITALGGSAEAITMDTATVGANPSYNRFYGFVIQINDGTGLALYNCDNNFFHDFRIFVTGAGNAVEFHGSNSNANYVARDNVLEHFTTTSSIIARGTSTYTYACGRNGVFNLDQTNATVAPTIETGARLSFSFLDGTFYRQPVINGIFASSETSANAGYDHLAGSSFALSAVFVNDAEANMRLMNTANNVAWNIIASNITADLIFRAAAGNGKVVCERALQVPSYAVASLPTGAAGDQVFASNGRKAGEGAGLGNGVLVFHDGTAWRACDTGATVAA